MSNTTNNQIPYVPQNTADPAAGLNESLRVIDALLNSRVENLGLTAPPGSPTDGQNWIVGVSATGAWAGKDNYLAAYVAEGDFWNFYAPTMLGLIFNLADSGVYAWNASVARYRLVITNYGQAPVHAIDGDLTSSPIGFAFNNIVFELSQDSAGISLSLAASAGSSTVDIQRVASVASALDQDAWDNHSLTTSPLVVSTGLPADSNALPIILLRENSNVWLVSAFVSDSGARASLWAKQENFPIEGEGAGSSVDSVNLKTPNSGGNVSLLASDIPFEPTSASTLADEANVNDALNALANRTATDVPYDGASSGLAADNVQDAVDLVAASTGKLQSNNQTGTTYTLALDDVGKDVKCSNTHMVTVTIPTHASVAFEPGAILFVSQFGNGSVILTGEDTSVLIIAPNGLQTTGLGDIRALECVDVDSWRVL